MRFEHLLHWTGFLRKSLWGTAGQTRTVRCADSSRLTISYPPPPPPDFCPPEAPGVSRAVAARLAMLRESVMSAVRHSRRKPAPARLPGACGSSNARQVRLSSAVPDGRNTENRFIRPRRLVPVLLLLAFIALLSTPSTTQAQTVTTLVSNAAKNSAGQVTLHSSIRAQGFTAGSDATFSSVEVPIASGQSSTGTLTVTLNSEASGGEPGDVLATLTNPASLVVGLNTFTDAANTALTSGETYFIVITYDQTTGGPQLSVTSDDDEDSGGVAGWTIGDSRHQRSKGNTNWSTFGTSLMIKVNGTAVITTETQVAADWALKPSGLSGGDKFRILFITSTRRNAVPTAIADYNSFVQGRAAVGHANIQNYSSGFTAVGSTEDVDARDNTSTTYTSSDKGVPIYWLDGNKVVDDYEDFYDGDWDEEVTLKNEFGTTFTATGATRVWTGSNSDGTEIISFGVSVALGTNSPRLGTPNNTTSGAGPLSGNGINGAKGDLHRLYALSGVFVVATTTVPGAPTGLSATANGSTTIDLDWTAPSDNGGSAITGYRIEVSPNGASNWTDLVANTGTTGTTYAHIGLSAGDTRHYRVSARNTNGAGAASNVANATTGTTVPGAPTGLSATANGSTTIDLDWTAPGDNGGSAITGYRIEVSSDAGSNWTDLVANTGSTGTTYAHIGLSAGDTRHYRVSARNTNGAGAASNVANATTVPGAPTADVTLVSNNSGTGNNLTDIHAQKFTTGPASHGYIITNVTVRLASTNNDSTSAHIKAHDSVNDIPGETLIELNNPGSLVDGSNTFMASVPLKVEPNQSYWLVVNEGINSNNQVAVVSRTGATPGTTDYGWRINGTGRFISSTNVWSNLHRTILMTITGAVLTVAPVPGEIELSHPLFYAAGNKNIPTWVRLSKEPSADVEVTKPSSVDHIVVLGSSTLTFTPANWSSWQTITLVGAPPATTNVAHTFTYTAASADPLFDGVQARQFVNWDAGSPPDYHLHRIRPSTGLALGERDLPDESMSVYVDFPFYETMNVATEGFFWTPSGIWGDRDANTVWVVNPAHFGIHPLKLSALRQGRIERHVAEVPSNTTATQNDYRFSHVCHFDTADLPPFGNPALTVLWGDDDYIWVANDTAGLLQAFDRDGPGNTCFVKNITGWYSSGNPIFTTAGFKTPFARDDSEDKEFASSQPGLRKTVRSVWSDGSTMWLILRPGGLHTLEETHTLDMNTGALAPSTDFGQFAVFGLWSDGETMWAAARDFLRAYDLQTRARRAEFDIKLRNTEPPNDIWSDGETIWVTYRQGFIDAFQPPEEFFAKGARPPARPVSSRATAVEPLTASFSASPEAHDGAREFSLRLAFSEDVQATPAALLDGSLDELLVFGGTLLAAAAVDGRGDLWELSLVPDGRGPVSILLSPAEGCKASGAAELCTADGRPLSGYLALQVPGPDGKSAGLTTPGEAASGPPQTPSRPEATVIFAGGVDLSWAETPGADTYEVQTWRGGQWLDLPGDGVEIGFYGAGAIISGLDPESTLWFQVRAVNAEGVSDWSPMLMLNATSEYTLGRHERAANEPATGAPVIQGKPEAGATLFAETSAIADGNGLQPSWFAYQWLSGAAGAETEITGETHLTYLLTEADEGQTIRVRLSFVDRAGYAESATSEALTIGAAATAAVNSPATGAPAITGAAQVGETLTADTSGIVDQDGLTNVAYSYQWLADDADIAGATDSTYTLVDADEGAAIKVKVSFTDDAGYDESLTSAATDTVTFAVQQQVANTPATGAPAISGTAQVGETFTADISGIADGDGLTNVAYSYQWLADDAEIAGVTGSSYTLANTDEGKAIKVQVSFTDDAGNAETLTSEATDAVKVATTTLNETASEPKAYITVVIAAGDDTVSWSDPDECISDYNTYLKVTSGPGTGTTSRTHIGSVASGSTEATQTISFSWTGDSLNPPSVKVELYCGTFDAGSSQNVLIASTNLVTQLYLAPQFTGLREGTYSSAPLTALGISSGTLSPAFDRGINHYTAEVSKDVEVITLDPTVLTGYQTDFVRNPGWGVLVACGRGCNYSYGNGTTTGIVLADADEESAGFQINLNRGENRLGIGVNKGERAAGPGRLYYLTVTVANSPATGLPTISGTAQVGETLTADTSGIADADGLTNATFTYQWLADDSDISGATNATYTLTDSEESKAITVQVSFTDDADNEETLTSGATDTVEAAPTTNSPATGAPTISGIAQVGETLTANTSGVADADGLSNVQYEYQWLADDADIAGATDGTYTLTDSEEGKALQVRVSFTDDAGNEESLTSAPTDAVAAAEPAEPPAPPTGLTAAPSHDQVVLSWDDPQDDSITGYVILRRNRATTAQGEFTELVADTGSAANTYTDDSVAVDTSYTYRIKAINGHGVSELSRWARADTPAAPVPAPPTGLTAAPSHDQVVLSWDDPQDDSITGYVILRRNRATTAPGEFTELVADTGSAATTYTDDSVSADTSYTYKIRAINEHGVSELSRWARADTPAPSPANSPATGAPTISGTVQVGETLTADTSGIADADGLSGAAFSYQWLADDADISGATATAYTLADADEGMAIKLRVSFTDDAGNEETLTSVATDTVEARPNSPATGAPTIAGTAQVGETLTADTSGIVDGDGLTNVAYSYQWLADDADIAGATDSSYTPTDGDEGAIIKLRVSFTDDAGNEETLTSAATEPVGFAVQQQIVNTPATGQPTISGMAQVGETLTADTSGISDVDGLSSVSYSYQWLADDAAITGATATTYTLTDSEQGKTVKVRVSFTDDAGNDESLTSAATGTVEARPNSPATGAPVIVGTAQVGETLTADTSGIADADGLSSVAYSYQWLADDADIAGATDSSYTPTDGDEGAIIKLRVSFTDDAGNEETMTSAATEPVGFAVQQQIVNTPATGQPTISGMAQVGETLTADTSGISDVDGLSSVSYSYQWLADDAAITGATATTYTLTDSEQGKTVKVRVSFTDDAGNDESLTSAATGTVEARPNSPATGAPVIVGTAQVGETLTADTSGIADADGLSSAVYHYQWIVSDGGADLVVPGAKASTYTVLAIDRMLVIKVRVHVTDDRGHVETRTSAPTAVVR